MGNKKSSVLLLLIPFFSSFGITITRDEVISNAQSYLNLNWTPSVDTCVIRDWQGNKIGKTFHSYYKKGITYTWEAYVWGGINTPSAFMSRINNGYCAGGYNTSSYGLYRPGHPENGSAASHFLAGIDCAAFVNSCLSQTIWQGIDDLKNRCLQIERDKVKKGDIWIKPHHVRLAGETKGRVYESHSERSSPPPGVVYRPVSSADYTPYSIFPQFSNPQLADGAVSVEIAVNAKYGKINKSGVEVKVDDDEVSDFTFTSLGGGKYKVSFHWDFTSRDSSPEHIVSVRADNEELGNKYRDEYKWGFSSVELPSLAKIDNITPSITFCDMIFIKENDTTLSDSHTVDVTMERKDEDGNIVPAPIYKGGTVYFSEFEIPLEPEGDLPTANWYGMFFVPVNTPNGKFALSADYAGVKQLEIDTKGIDTIWVDTKKPTSTIQQTSLSQLCHRTYDLPCVGTEPEPAPERKIHAKWSDNISLPCNCSEFPKKVKDGKTSVVCPLYHWEFDDEARDVVGHKGNVHLEGTPPGIPPSPPDCDHPDETYDISGQIPDWTPDSTADIAVLMHGFFWRTGEMLEKFGDKTRVVDITDVAVDNGYSSLIIPSGGLYGLENSSIFKQKLENFVSNGGALICFTQQHGYEWDALPVPEGETLSGYGWSEDRSCHYKAVYLDEWNVVLSGQTRLTPDMNVDGWFAEYPYGAELLLNRTSSGMPAFRKLKVEG